MTKKEKQKAKEEAKRYLLTLLEPTSTVWVQNMHRSKSGMTHYIQVLAIKDNQIRNIGYHTGIVTGRTWTPDHYVKMGGTGYSHGGELIEELSYVLFGETGKLEYGSV